MRPPERVLLHAGISHENAKMVSTGQCFQSWRIHELALFLEYSTVAFPMSRDDLTIVS